MSSQHHLRSAKNTYQVCKLPKYQRSIYFMMVARAIVNWCPILRGRKFKLKVRGLNCRHEHSIKCQSFFTSSRQYYKYFYTRKVKKYTCSQIVRAAWRLRRAVLCWQNRLSRLVSNYKCKNVYRTAR